MSQANIFKFLDRFLPSTASRIYLSEVPIRITTSDDSIFLALKNIPIGIYFPLNGEFWQIHPLQSYKDIVTPFILPLQFQFCADFHLILCSVKQYEAYPKQITDIWRRYGFGVIIIDNHSEPPVKLVDYPLAQYVFPEVRHQVQDYVKETKGIEFFREPFWVKENDPKAVRLSPALELQSLLKTTKENNSEPKSSTFSEEEDQSYRQIIIRLQNNEIISIPEQQGLVTYIFKQIEYFLRSFVNSTEKNQLELIKLIDHAFEENFITEQVKNFLHTFRQGRNIFIHRRTEENPLSNIDLLTLCGIMQDLEKKVEENTSLAKSNREIIKLTKKDLKHLPKKVSDKLPYGKVKRHIDSINAKKTKITPYNNFLTVILKKYNLSDITNPKILSYMLADKIQKDIDIEELSIEIESCCKDINPDKDNYPLLLSLGG